MGAALSMRGQMMSSGYFSSGILSRIQSSSVSSRMLIMDSEASTGSTVSGSQVMRLILSFSSGDNICRSKLPCSL